VNAIPRRARHKKKSPSAPREGARGRRVFAIYPVTLESAGAAIAWLVEVRYSAGNPWAAVTDPAVVRREATMRIERTLSAALWRRLRTFIDGGCADPTAHRARGGAADGRLGLAPEETAHARREHANQRSAPWRYRSGS
jgi:hypothetical protein